LEISALSETIRRDLAMACGLLEGAGMRILGRLVMLAGSTILGTLACSSSNSVSNFSMGVGADSGVEGFADATAGGFAPGLAASTCSEDAGVLTPIGPEGCAANQTVVYRKPIAGTGASGIASGAGSTATPQPASLTACTDTKCGPGQVAVVTYQAIGSSAADGGGPDDAATAFGDGAAPVTDGGPALAPDGAGSVMESDAAGPLPGDAALPSDGETPDAALLATTDASDAAVLGEGDGGAIGIPCGAIVTCVDSPPSCPNGQSPSYTPNGNWHCMPLCDSNSSNTVVITYGASYGNTTICANAPPAAACPTQGDVWTWDYNNEEWVCSPECDDGQYDQHDYGGQTVCVPC
jgi:hypothetical protein